MMAGTRLQDEALAKEQLKIQRKREANELRRQRILNAKTRLFGVDVDALNAQVAEKRRNEERDRELANFERAQAMEIERILAQSMEEERQMKQFQMQQMKDSWAQEAARKREEKNRPPEKDLDPENAGTASLLNMNGEDRHHEERTRLQKEQMQKWIQEQLAEKAYQKQIEKEDELSYADMLKIIDEIRDATEKEEQEMRKYITDTVKLENLELAKHQNSRRDTQNSISGENNAPLMTSLNVFDEDRSAAMDENGRIKRKDVFRGFTEEQKRRIFMENQELIREHAMLRANEDKTDRDWMLQQMMAMRAMEQAEFEEQGLRAAMRDDYLAFLREQIKQQNQIRAMENKDVKGAIGSEFFEWFGRDCR